MAKQLVLAVAGSGKTTKILDSIDVEKRSLVITYTNENLRSLEAGIIQRFGYVPDNVYLLSYFSFLYTFCFRPYFSYKLRDRSFTWEIPRHYPGAPGKNRRSHYMTKGRYLYGNRVAKFVQEFGGVPKVIRRLEKYFDNFLIDEIQDFSANDFNLLMALSAADINMLFVGDFFQHTFDTSRDGNIRQNLHKNGVNAFIEEFRKVGMEIDTTSLDKTHRCSPDVCEFISKNIGIQIRSHRSDHTRVIQVDDPEVAKGLFFDDKKVKLFLQDQSKYGCYANNWGKAKGLNNYIDVCVVLNKGTQTLFAENRLSELAESTRNKFYVACSRANKDLYLVDERHVEEFKRQ